MIRVQHVGPRIPTPGTKTATFAAAFTGNDPLLRHVRAGQEPADKRRRRAVLRTLRYDHLYRAPIGDGDGDAVAVAVEINRYRHIYNTAVLTKPLTTAPRGRPTSRPLPPKAATQADQGV
jgi:hypothetical protein